MATESPIALVPAAFHILWEAALNDERLLNSDFAKNVNDLHISNSKTPQKGLLRKPHLSGRTRSLSESSMDCNNGSTSSGSSSPSPRRADPTIRLKETHDFELTRQLSIDLAQEMSSLYARETAAVCVMECGRGEALVKKSFHDLMKGGKYGRAKTEDFLLNWLSSDLTSQHACAVDVTLYLSCPPQSTTSDGLRLWVEGLRDQGKQVTLQVRLASLGTLHPFHTQSGAGAKSPDRGGGDSNPFRTQSEPKQETLQGLRRLEESDIIVTSIAPREWPELLSLLADKMAVKRLENSYTLSSNQLKSLLASAAEDSESSD